MANLPKSLLSHAAWQADYVRELETYPYYGLVAPVVEDFLRKIIDEGEFYVRVRPSSLKPILESGFIRSMAETGSGTTSGGLQTRKEVTEALFGCKASSLQAEDFPKYGFLSQKDPVVDLYVNGEMWAQYGDVSIQLKKENLIHRTTLCVGDSVNFGRCFTLIPTRTDNVKATCVCGPSHGRETIYRFQDLLFCYAKMAEWILTGKLTTRNFPKIDSLAQGVPPVFEFFELQFHGPIDIRKDIRRIDVIPTGDDERTLLSEIKLRFEAEGVPFYIDSHLF